MMDEYEKLGTVEEERDRLCRALAARTNTDEQDWYPVFKARYGMEIAFRTLREAWGAGRVLTQLYTCCTAVDPIIVAGLTPEYLDVDAATLSIDTRRLEERLSAGGQSQSIRAAVLQHTFGILDEEDADRRFVDLAHGQGVLVMEDCAHCVGRMSMDENGYPLADVSVHSFGVEKMLPTRFGGAIWVNPKLRSVDSQLDAAVRLRLSSLDQPGARLDLVTRMYINENRVFSRLGGLGNALRNGFTKAGLYEPPISEVERRGGLEYKAFAPTPWMCRKASDSIWGLDANEKARKRVVNLYYQCLLGPYTRNPDGTEMPEEEIPGYVPGLVEMRTGLWMPRCAVEGDIQPLLRYPLFVRDAAEADRIIAVARAAGAYAERWYRPELFPGVTDPAAYGLDQLDRSTVPVTNELVGRALCLPTELPEDRAIAVGEAVMRAIDEAY